jgi:ankyrin repeat protein
MASNNDLVNTLTNLSKYINLRQNDDEVFVNLAKDGHIDLVEAFIKLGADIHVDNDCALRCTARSGHLAVVECLIKNGADSATPNLGVAANIHAGLATPRPDKSV